jgi:hypothetical protein
VTLRDLIRGLPQRKVATTIGTPTVARIATIAVANSSNADVSTLRDLIRGGPQLKAATAILATFATDPMPLSPTVARIAGIAVADPSVAGSEEPAQSTHPAVGQCGAPVEIVPIAPKTPRDGAQCTISTDRAVPEGEPWDAADWRVYYDERAAIAEYDGGLPRPAAEARAWDCCVIEWLNQHAVRSAAGWCQACRGNGVVKPLLPYGTETTGHVWLHAECWPSWHVGRRDEAQAALKAMGVGMRASL